MIKVLRMFLIIVLLLCAMVFGEDLPVADSAVVDDAVAAGSPSRLTRMPEAKPRRIEK